MEMIDCVEEKGVAMKKNSHSTKRHTTTDRLFRYAERLNYGELHIKVDSETHLRAIVAIHNLKRGPAIGGLRFIHYDTTDEAIVDVLRLGRMMSYKAAIHNLPHGGAKSVIIKPKHYNRETCLEKFGEFVESLGGSYITAMDSGTSAEDMDVIARRTRYVTCTTGSDSSGDPSPLTALGVRRGIEAAVKFKLQRDSLEGIHVAVQGAGHVGHALLKELHDRGAVLTVCDVNQRLIERAADEFNATIVSTDQIYDVKADVFAPCALGAILNLKTIPRLRVSIVAGSANNQLAHAHHGQVLHDRGILYAPDFVINAGGLIHVAVVYDHGNLERSQRQIEDIYFTTLEIMERARAEDRPTSEIALQMAEEKLR